MAGEKPKPLLAAEDLIQRSYDIITAYCDNDLEPFFNSISDNVLWIGPRGGRVLLGKDAVIKSLLWFYSKRRK